MNFLRKTICFLCSSTYSQKMVTSPAKTGSTRAAFVVRTEYETKIQLIQYIVYNCLSCLVLYISNTFNCEIHIGIQTYFENNEMIYINQLKCVLFFTWVNSYILASVASVTSISRPCRQLVDVSFFFLILLIILLRFYREC